MIEQWWDEEVKPKLTQALRGGACYRDFMRIYLRELMRLIARELVRRAIRDALLENPDILPDEQV